MPVLRRHHAPRRYYYPLSSVFYRKLNRPYSRIVRGEGCWLFDESGKRYLDAVGGAYVANLGHGLREIGEAMARQAGQIAYVNGTAFTNEPAEELAHLVAKHCPGDLQKVYFLSSGSEAVEAACKLARQYWVESGKPGKHKIIATKPGYHGNTLMALSTSARQSNKALFNDWLVDVPMIPAPYSYRCPCKGKESDCPACSGSALEAAILEQGSHTVAAFIIEPVGGSSTGCSVPRPDYFRRIRQICDKHDVLLIADEVLTGVGRTGAWSAIEHFDVTPDIMTLGKGLSGGYAPLSAVVTSEKILEPIAKGTGSLNHNQTFSHTPIICAAGLAAMRYIQEHNLLERARKMGESLQTRLARLLELPAIGDVRGKGMLVGVEFVKDRITREPFPRHLKTADVFTEEARDEGLIVWPNSGHADGDGDLVMIAPPFTITDKEISEIRIRFEKALERTLSRLRLAWPSQKPTGTIRMKEKVR
jgi:adenosylmethionine-8-amino-7-oxononanoate aminotransferase